MDGSNLELVDDEGLLMQKPPCFSEGEKEKDVHSILWSNLNQPVEGDNSLAKQ